MKLAILFSGRIHKFKEHYENIMTNIVGNHTADFFLSHSPELKEDLESFEQIYHPKKINNAEIVFATDYSSFKLHPLTNMHNFMSMWYNRKRVFNELIEYMISTNTVYDIIVSLRLDAFNDEKLDFEQLIQQSKLRNEEAQQVVFIPEEHDWGGINDQLAFGNFESMQIYMSLYDDIWTLMKEQPQFGPETILLGHLLKNDMCVYRFPFKYRLKNGKMFH